MEQRMMEPVHVVPRRIWRDGSPSVGSRSIPEETAVALTYNGGTHAVMMATPRDLEDFAVGFSLSEGVIGSAADIESLDIVPLDDGVELRMWLSKPKADRLRERQGADCAASIQSQKPCVPRLLSGTAGNSRRSRSCLRCRMYRRIKSLT